MSAPTYTFSVPESQAERERRLDARHSIIGVVWLIYWLSNSYNWISDLIPFANYYLFTAIFLIYIAVSRPIQIIRLLTRPGIWVWSLTVIVPSVMYLSASRTSTFNYIAVRERIVFFSVVASTALLFNDKSGPQILRRAAGFALIMAIVVNLSELVITNPYNRSSGGGRAAGFYADANISANAICALLVMTVDITRQSMRGLVTVAFAYLGVLITLSRSAMIFSTLLATAYLFVPRGRGTLSTGSRLVILFSGIFFVMISVVVATTIFDFSTREAWRIQSIVNMDLSDMSSQSRLDRLLFGIQQMGKYLWTGRGPGESVAYNLSAHNSYVTIGYDYGIFGVLFYLCVIGWGWVKVMTRGWARAASYGVLATQIAFYSMFAHDIFLHPVFAVVFGIFLSDVMVKDEAPIPARAPSGSGIRQPWETSTNQLGTGYPVAVPGPSSPPGRGTR